MSVEQQVLVLNQILEMMHRSAGSKYDTMRCEFKYETYDGGWSVDLKYSLVRNGVFVSKFLDDPEDRVPQLVHELHELMEAHTGGRWHGFVLALDENGRANSSFDY
ncbi:hypothetical protein [Aquincola tertiaricarbonis]|uniref:hypothetical protein n=1 Tax=Aquincola tertiaricarbonis TaxID=391953 RepID=UPI0012ED72FC|nr:hypothetical protein [Aquincola tertiaricarbonis]